MSHLSDFPSLVFGWLKVSTLQRNSQQKRMLWVPQCVLLIENERTVLHFESEESVRLAMEGRRFKRSRLDGGDSAFRRALTTAVIGRDAPLLEPGSNLLGPKAGRGIRGAISEDGGLAWGKDRPGDCGDGASHSGSRWKNIFRSKAKNVPKPEKRKSSGPVYLDIPSSGSDSFETKPPEPRRLKRSFSLNRLRLHKGDRPGSPRTRASFRKEPTSASAQPPRAHSHECLYTEGPNGTCAPNDGPWERQPRFLYGPITPSCSVSYGVERSATVRAVHPSLVQGQEFCFAVIGADGEAARYYASHKEEERRRWMAALKRTAKPQLANERHFENSLRLVIQEVKNVSPKKSYFCEIRLDNCLNARTTTKSMSTSMTEMLFWGEEFEFHNLNAVNAITIELRKDPGERKGKKGSGKKAAAQLGGLQSRGLAQLIASVSILSSDVQKRAEVEKWYTAYPPSNNGDSSGETTYPQIRIKARYLSVDVLPQRCYRALQEYLAKNSLFLMRQLEPVLNVKSKEELAGTLVNIHHKIRKVDELLADLTAQEIEGPGDESMIFRGNSFATKAVECYLKIAGEKYLEDTLSDLVQAVMGLERDVEVDPVALGDSGASLQQNQATVRDLVTQFWVRILQSESQFPVELRKAFSAMRARLTDLGHKPALCDQVISACVFLRYLCPAILNPVLFRLVREWPSDLRVNRAFTLLAKTIQVLANFSQFGRKEDYMTFLNDFVREEGARMRNFLRAISNVRRSDSGVMDRGASQSPEDFIDLPYELAMAHQQLSLMLPNLPREAQSQRLVAQLNGILRQLTRTADNGGPYNDPCAPVAEANGRAHEETSLQDVQQLLQTLNIEQQAAKPPAHLYQPRQRRQPAKGARDQPGYQPLYQQPFPDPPHDQQHKKQLQQRAPSQQQQPQKQQPSPTQKQQPSPTQKQPPPPPQQQQQQQQQPHQRQPQKQPRSPQKSPPNPSPAEGPPSPVRRMHRNSHFVVPRASEEVVSILSTDSEGVTSPCRSSWGGEVGGAPPGAVPENRRSSAHSTASAFDSLSGRERKGGGGSGGGGGGGGSASSIPGVRMGTRSILRGVSTEKTAGEYEQEVRVLVEENSALRQQLQDTQQRAQRSEEEARRLQAQLESQEALVRRLQAQLDAATMRQQSATYMPHYAGRRYIPSSASSGSLHSLATSGVAPTSLNDLSSAGRPRKSKQTMC